MTLNILAIAWGLSSDVVQSSINVATCVALLGAYIGLSVEGTLLSAWDTWLLLLAPILGIIGVALTYFLTPQASILTVYNATATAALIACALFWWLRPSCWKKQPGPTFLFGLVPLIMLGGAVGTSSLHNFFLLQVTATPIYTYGNINNCFFAQVILLCLFLGCIRIAKSELSN
jgi:hypothetical protein